MLKLLPLYCCNTFTGKNTDTFLDSIKTSQPAKGKARRTTGPFHVETRCDDKMRRPFGCFPLYLLLLLSLYCCNTFIGKNSDMFLDSIKTSQPAKGKVRRTTGPFYVERHNAMMERGGRLVEVPSLPVEEGRRGTGGGVEFGRHEAAQAGRQAGEGRRRRRAAGRRRQRHARADADGQRRRAVARHTFEGRS